VEHNSPGESRLARDPYPDNRCRYYTPAVFRRLRAVRDCRLKRSERVVVLGGCELRPWHHARIDGSPHSWYSTGRPHQEPSTTGWSSARDQELSRNPLPSRNRLLDGRAVLPNSNPRPRRAAPILLCYSLPSRRRAYAGRSLERRFTGAISQNLPARVGPVLRVGRYSSRCSGAPSKLPDSAIPIRSNSLGLRLVAPSLSRNPDSRWTIV